MKARPIMFLMVSLYSSYILNVADSKLFERKYDTSRLIFNVPGGQLPSMSHCAALCNRSPSCKAFCYSRSTALCHLSQPYDPIVQDYDVSDSKCYMPTGCPMTKSYAWYGARCIKGYAEKKNYTDARAICTQDGGHLYHFMSLEWDMPPLLNLRVDDGTLYGHLWVGADDLETGGQFKWSDSSLLANDSSLWGPGYPSGYSQRTGIVTAIDTSFVRNVPCSMPVKIVCQIDV